MRNLAKVLLLLAAAGAAPGATWDTSGNGMLSGTYYFRQVFYLIGDQYGDIGQAIALYGNIAFSGTGTYSITGTVAFNCSASPYGYPYPPSCSNSSVNMSGTYSIAGSGYGFLSNPLASAFAAGVDANVYGLVSQSGIFVSSSTESGVNDIFIAAPVASPAPTVSSFTGTWTCADLDLGAPYITPGYTAYYDESAMFQLNPDGAGHFSMSGTGYFGGAGNGLAASYAQSGSGLPYLFSNGAAVATFPSTGALVAGQRYLYFSKDGNFLFGGAPNSFDMIVGVRTGTGTPSFTGLYYEAGVDDWGGELDTFYGSFYALSSTLQGHERVQDLFGSPTTYDYTYSLPYTLNSDGTSSNALARSVVGAGGVRISSGIGPYLSLEVAVPKPAPTGPGVFLSPIEVRNAASWAPFTAGIAPGEILVLSGSGLAPDGLQVASTIPIPPILNGVQVTIGGLPAPIYYVSPGQIAAWVPYAVTGPVVTVQVNNNGTLSNVVTTYLRQSAPGIFTQNQGGSGVGKILHADNTPVTEASPAQIGETVQIFLTGLGAVSPAVADGAPGPSDTFSQVPAGSVTAFVNGVPATVGYAGLAPTLVLYQLNITIPTGLTAGDNIIEVDGPDSSSVSATIPITTSTTATSSAAKPVAARKGRARIRR